MDQPEANQNKLIEHVTSLLEDYRNIVSIRVTEHISQGVATSVIGVLSIFTMGFAFLFIGLGIAWLLGMSWNNLTAGFFFVGGVYLVIFTVLLLSARKIWIPKIRNMVIKKIYEQD